MNDLFNKKAKIRFKTNLFSYLMNDRFGIPSYSPNCTFLSHFTFIPSAFCSCNFSFFLAFSAVLNPIGSINNQSPDSKGSFKIIERFTCNHIIDRPLFYSLWHSFCHLSSSISWIITHVFYYFTANIILRLLFFIVLISSLFYPNKSVINFDMLMRLPPRSHHLSLVVNRLLEAWITPLNFFQGERGGLVSEFNDFWRRSRPENHF